MPLQIMGPTSGSVTIQPTDTTTSVLTLPANTGTILSTANPQSGGVIQVVQATYSSSFTTTSGTLAATGMQASITPKFSTSKILILTVNSVYIQYTSSDWGCGVGIARNGSLVFNDSNGFNNFYSSTGTGNFRNRTPYNYLDSPGTTSSVTYALYMSAYNGQARLNADGQPSTITLMEIAA